MDGGISIVDGHLFHAYSCSFPGYRNMGDKSFAWLNHVWNGIDAFRKRFSDCIKSPKECSLGMLGAIYDYAFYGLVIGIAVSST